MLICRMIYRLLDALLCYEIFACNSSSSPGLRRIPGTRNPERQIGWFVHRFKDVVGSEIKYIYKLENFPSTIQAWCGTS